MIQTVYDIKVRLYRQLGDDPIAQRFYDWDKLRLLVSDGVAYQRAACGEIWNWARVSAVAGTGEYELPANAQRPVRIAWRDQTLTERSRMYLEAVDWNWQARTGTPREFTQDGLAQNRFRLYPRPTVDSPDTVEFEVDPDLLPLALSPGEDYGRIGRMEGVDFGVDPELVGIAWPDEDLGIIVGGFPMSGELGKIVRFTPDFSESVNIWFVEKAPADLDDGDPVPIAGPWRLGPWCYALWKIYEEEGDHHNAILSAFFRDWFFEIVGRCNAHARNPLPRIVHVMRPVGPGPGGRRRTRYERRFPDTMTDLDGNTWEILW